MAKKKFYVVWQGINPGVYDSWDKCKAQVEGFEGARYKSFPTKEIAERAFNDNPWKYIGANKAKQANSNLSIDQIPEIIKNSIAVDAACSGNPGVMEYRGVYTGDGVQIFHDGPYQEGTNNIGEFLGIVYALALLKNKNSRIPIYTDSKTAIAWIRKKKCNSKLERTALNDNLFEIIERAEKWLATNVWENDILKWNTEKWGEIPADFGRK